MSSSPRRWYDKTDVSELVSFVAKHIYPDENQTKAKNRVRNRIAYAKEKDLLAPGVQHNTRDFFDWARTNEDWAKLRGIPGLPRNLVRVYGFLDMKWHVVPDNLEEAIQEWKEALNQLDLCRAQLAQCEKENDKFKERYRIRSNARKGRKGGALLP